jgi:translation initiation factor 1
MKLYKKTENPLVYTTNPRGASFTQNDEAGNLELINNPKNAHPLNSIIRIRREVKGRNGKTVTTVKGLPLNPCEMTVMTSDLKRSCGTGGTAKDGIIIIQGDHREKIMSWLENKGFRVRLTGG